MLLVHMLKRQVHHFNACDPNRHPVGNCTMRIRHGLVKNYATLLCSLSDLNRRWGLNPLVYKTSPIDRYGKGAKNFYSLFEGNLHPKNPDPDYYSPSGPSPTTRLYQLQLESVNPNFTAVERMGIEPMGPILQGLADAHISPRKLSPKCGLYLDFISIPEFTPWRQRPRLLTVSPTPYLYFISFSTATSLLCSHSDLRRVIKFTKLAVYYITYGSNVN